MALFSRLDSELTVTGNALDLGKVPLLVAKRTNTTRLQPSLDAIEMEDMAAVSKGNGQSVIVRRRRVRLVLDRGLIE